jgi:hypothetical protein
MSGITFTVKWINWDILIVSPKFQIPGSKFQTLPFKFLSTKNIFCFSLGIWGLEYGT